MKRNSLIMASLGGAAMLAAAGVAVGVTAADERVARTTLTAATAAPGATTIPDGGATGASTGVPAATSAPGRTGAVDQQRAGEIALARAGGGRIVEVEAEHERGRAVWSVEIVNDQTEHEVDVDRNDGTVVKAEQEPVDDGRDDDRDDDRDDRDDDRDDYFILKGARFGPVPQDTSGSPLVRATRSAASRRPGFRIVSASTG
ncbi:PepSY domain-containing protein [Micromonospora sp. ATCC 39149]|uniref:PepSY domain-containing protein n=1 Tax=Micromonospora sp. (strain ATCC 39149 / NRRL 15099 / SCC 1413) TaxID=219305 RepID=UPI000566F9A9|nr:PepSY domain-containing protein [Micromonospora sp. ATCC 39149]